MSTEHLRILVGALALLIGGALVYTDLRTGEELNAATVALAAAFTTAAAVLTGNSKPGA